MGVLDFVRKADGLLEQPLPMEGRAAFLPFRDSLPGSVFNKRELALPGILASMLNAFTAPGRAYRGQLGDPTEEAVNLAGMLQLGATAAPAQAGAGTVRMFAGVNANTADKSALTKAQAMAKANADPRVIWSETGWFKGADGKWRFEIDDSEALFNPSVIMGRTLENALAMGPDSMNYGSTVGGMLQHRKLQDAYGTGIVPNTFVRKKNTMLGDGPRGMYDDNAITLFAPAPATEAKSTTLHELQHAIQSREGFAAGGSPATTDDPAVKKQVAKIIEMLSDRFVAAQKAGDKQLAHETFNDMYWLESPTGLGAYKRLAGEAEARAVQHRMHMTPAQRRATFPFDSYDVPPDQLIIR